MQSIYHLPFTIYSNKQTWCEGLSIRELTAVWSSSRAKGLLLFDIHELRTRGVSRPRVDCSLTVGLRNVKGMCGEGPRCTGKWEWKRDWFWEQAEIRVKHRQGSESRKVKLRGDPKTELASTQTRVEAGKSEIYLTCKKPKLTHMETGYYRGGGVTENLNIGG